MAFGNSGDPLNSLNNLLIFLDDSSDNEEIGSFSRILKLLSNETNNMNATASARKRRRTHVGVQVVPEIDEVYNSWLWEAERKIDEFCVQLSNLENTLYHARNRVIKTKNKSFVSKNIHSGKSYLPSSNSKRSGCTKMPGDRSENQEDSLIFELIEDRLDSALQSAMDLKNTIPKVDLEKCCDIIQKEYEIIESTTVKETSILRLERSKSSLCSTTSCSSQVFNIKRERTLPTISESKFKHRSQIPPSTGKFDNICPVPKTKNVVKKINSAPGTFRQPSNAQGRDLHFQDVVEPTKDTGAIPKNRETRKITTTSTTIRTRKTKKTNVKPLWR